MSEKKPIEVERVGRAIVLRPQNKLIDDLEVKALGQKLEEAAGDDSGVSVVVVDLAKVAILPSLVLGLLTQVNGRCAARKQTLKLARVQPEVKKVFAVTHLDRIFQFADTVEAAIA